MTVVITGAHGFIGRNIAKHFAGMGWSVIGIGHGSWSKEEWQQWGITEWHQSDITTDALLALSGLPDAIVHCSGSSSVGFSFENPREDFERSVVTTIHVLDFVRQYSPTTKIVVLSSAGVYGDIKNLPISETDVLNPISPYGVHKKIVEEISKSYADHFGLTVSVLRLFSVYGAGLKKQLLWDACIKALRGEFSFFGTGKELRDWIHVRDVASLTEHVICHSANKFNIYNGATGEGVSVEDILNVLFSSLGVTASPVFSGIAKLGDPAGYVAEISKARALGWRPSISWQQGVREFATWFTRLSK